MAGRGRGRGRGISFNIEALGFGRGEALPTSVQQPPPLFPPQVFKPVDLIQSDDTDYMLALKQEFRGAARKAPYHLNPTEKKRDIDRYSDKYQLGQNDNNDNWKPDWRRLPKELRILEKKVRKPKAIIKPKEEVSVDVLKTLEILEKKDGEGETQATEENEEEEEKKEEEEEEIFDEDDLEEETDYNVNYFDNGEGYGDDDEDVDEGPIY
ncbi:DNA-directed RNA polymerase III subunit RPC7-like [Gigantopelta aegis]|uniref:DNA-directed RNA polymerase III subunit RPC7-like n=1 Tax=Gigantopelta aegis TaxID=1735272 RepID=UPI001B88ADAA|nr:DNA-directed RNA polymerase III subunit RPC7-like [Gigantopelta aegis]XP_041361840.1 DNA-directed RNA polymerase III subunit RPC7-like [Gigantopelta aegis]